MPRILLRQFLGVGLRAPHSDRFVAYRCIHRGDVAELKALAWIGRRDDGAIGFQLPADRGASVDLSFGGIDDPKGMCRDISNIGKWGNGDVETSIATLEEIDDAMYLIRQSFAHQEEFESALAM